MKSDKSDKSAPRAGDKVHLGKNKSQLVSKEPMRNASALTFFLAFYSYFGSENAE